MTIGRALTSGTYHKMMDGGCAVCNTRSGIRCRPATEQEKAKADPSSFCKKCFPTGKPA